MSKRKPVLVLTDNEQIKRMIRAAAPARVETICVSSMSGIVLPLTQGLISMAIVDLASRAISGDDLMAIARVMEGRDLPLLIMTRQPRQAVKALAAVLSARDVVSTTETQSLIGARLRMWLGPDPELDVLPVGFAIVTAGAAAH